MSGDATRELRAETLVHATPDRVWEIDPADAGTRVVLRRPVNKVTTTARLFAKAFLGGLEQHVDDLEGDLRVTLERFKAAAET